MSQHTIGNFDVSIDGDRASSKVHFYNPMGRPKADGTLSLFWIGGFYVDDLVRTSDGWRIQKRVEQQAWADIR